jgi:hypothetical protein
MLADTGHAGLLEALQQAARQLGNRPRLGVQCAIADHAAIAVIDVENRGEGQIYAMGAQFRRQDKCRLAGEMPRLLRVGIPYSAQFPHGRYCRESFAKALHPAAFVIDRNEEGRIAQRMNVIGQPHQLPGIRVIPGKQDYASHQWMQQAAAVICR